MSENGITHYCLGNGELKCEHCGQPAMRGFWICKRCWEIFGDDE